MALLAPFLCKGMAYLLSLLLLCLDDGFVGRKFCFLGFLWADAAQVVRLGVVYGYLMRGYQAVSMGCLHFIHLELLELLYFRESRLAHI